MYIMVQEKEEEKIRGEDRLSFSFGKYIKKNKND